ncbi:MAG: DUF2934 domain-containing protein [Phycisphaeraceae bacterium]
MAKRSASSTTTGRKRTNRKNNGEKSGEKVKKTTRAAAKGTASERDPARSAELETSGATLNRPTHDEIARLAYDIWVAKGRPIGQDEQNWQEAEQQLADGQREQAP